MLKRSVLPIALLATLLCAAPAGAASKYRVGISDQDYRMFHHPAFQKLGLQKVRYMVPWNGIRSARQVGEMDAFINTAFEKGFEPFVTFTAVRGCYNGKRYAKRKRKCGAPKPAQFKKAFLEFRARYPGVEVFSPWNEANHKSQPTAGKPKLAAKYYNVLRANCAGCTIVAADVLDQRDAVRYLQAFRRKAKGAPRIWGLHNYTGMNRRRPAISQAVLRAVPGEVWLTETGGVVRFVGFRHSESRAAKVVKYLFNWADRYDTRVRGMRSRITRIYYYQWTGAKRSARFDSGLTKPNGKTRKNYKAFKKQVKRRKK